MSNPGPDHGELGMCVGTHRSSLAQGFQLVSTSPNWRGLASGRASPLTDECKEEKENGFKWVL